MDRLDNKKNSATHIPVIELENVDVAYAGRESKVLDDINLNLYEKEFVCLLGPSGCGKSTLLKIMAGFIAPTNGTAKIDQQPITKPAWQRGVVFQQPPLYPWLSIEANVEFGLKMRNLPRKERLELVHNYLGKVGLGDFKKYKPYELSGGMRQRVAIARALINRPRVLLMDEPFGALDALTRGQMQHLLRSIWWESNNTIFFITHDVDEALSLGTRVLVMSNRPGKLIAEFNPTFTYHITDDNDNRTRYTGEFFSMREKILDMIHHTGIEYSI